MDIFNNNVQEQLLNAIRRAVRRRGIIKVRGKGLERTITPHRLWKQPDGTYLLETYQLGGDTPWRRASEAPIPTSVSRSGGHGLSLIDGFEGWMNIPFETIEEVEDLEIPFTPRSDYNPEPTHMLGEIDTQVEPQEPARQRGVLGQIRSIFDSIAGRIESAARRVETLIRQAVSGRGEEREDEPS